MTILPSKLNLPLVRAKDCIFSNKFAWGNTEPEDYLLFVQITHFECGGRAMGFRISHKIGDVCTLINFLKDWAAMNVTYLQPASVHSGEDKRPSPQFTGASLLPPINYQTSSPFVVGSHKEVQVVCKRFRFCGNSLTKLQAFVYAEDHDLLSSSSETKPRYVTRVELVTALLFKCIVAATAKTSPLLHGSTTIIPSNLLQEICTHMDIVIENEEQMKLSKIVTEGKKVKLELKERMKQHYDGTLKNDLSKLVLENQEKMALRFEKDVFFCSSFCGFPLYNIDFGFGLPILATLGSVHREKVIFLMDTLEGDGVEALVTLEDKVMSVFENEEEIRSFASTI